jgi:hypothetical protein
MRIGLLISLCSATVHAQEAPSLTPPEATDPSTQGPAPATPSSPPPPALEVAPAAAAPAPAAAQPQSTTVVAPSGGLEITISAAAAPATPGVELKVLPSGTPPPVGASAPDAVAASEPPARYSVGAGIGFVGYGDVQSGAASLGAYYGGALPAAVSRAPIGTTLLEYAVSSTWRLTAGINGSYQRMVSGEHRVQNYPEKAWSVGGTVGVRRVLNPGGVVEVSPILVLGAYRAKMHGVTAHGTDVDGLPIEFAREDRQRGLDGRLGLVLEHGLLANLYLRMDVYFLRVGYSKNEVASIVPDGADRVDQRKDVSLGYGLSPSLSLRLTF